MWFKFVAGSRPCFQSFFWVPVPKSRLDFLPEGTQYLPEYPVD